MRLSNKFSNWKIKTWHTNILLLLDLGLIDIGPMDFGRVKTKDWPNTFWAAASIIIFVCNVDGRKTSSWGSIHCWEQYKTVTICSLLLVCPNQSQISQNIQSTQNSPSLISQFDGVKEYVDCRYYVML